MRGNGMHRDTTWLTKRRSMDASDTVYIKKKRVCIVRINARLMADFTAVRLNLETCDLWD